MTKVYFISYSSKFSRSLRELKHVGLLFQLVDELKQFVPILPVSAAHITLTFRLKQEDFPNLLVQVTIKNDLNLTLTRTAALDVMMIDPGFSPGNWG